MKKTHAFAATAIAAALTLAGCSDTPDPAIPDVSLPPVAGGTTPDPCALLTLDEVSTALGQEFTIMHELPAGGMPGQRTCSYEISDTSLGIVSVAVWPFDEAGLDAFMAAAGEVSGYDGIGEVAFGEPRSLWALDNGLMVNVTISFVDLPAEDGVEPVDPILALTRDAVSRLP